MKDICFLAKKIIIHAFKKDFLILVHIIHFLKYKYPLEIVVFIAVLPKCVNIFV